MYQASKDLSTKRQRLIGQKLLLVDQKSQLDADLTSAKAKQKLAEKALANAGKNPSPDLAKDLEAILKDIALLNRQATDAALRIGLTDSLVSSIDTFGAAIRIVPDGARRSAIATAALHEFLHKPQPANGTTEQISHILLVKAQPGQAQQLIDDRPFWFKDTFSTMVDVSVTYVLIEAPSSHLVASGTLTGTAKARGKIGDEPTTQIGMI